jgi:hypothetical protein
VKTVVEIQGIRNTLDVLKELDNDVRKEVLKGLRGSANELRDEARGLVKGGQPLSGWKNWRGGYDAATIVSGIKTTTAKRRSKGTVVSNTMGVQNTSAAGAIWELAGRKTNGAPPQPGINPKTGWTYGNGRSFIAKIRSASGKTASRLVWDAHDSPQSWNQDQAADDILELVNKATETAQKRLGELGG